VGPHFSAALTKNRSTFRSLHIKAVLLRTPPSISRISPSIFQIKNKSSADTNALRLLRPIDLHRDPRRPLPYLAVVIELGNESNYQKHKGPIQVTPSSKRTKGAFKILLAAFHAALRRLNVYEEKKEKEKKAREAREAKEKGAKEKSQKDPERTKLRNNVKATRAKMDAYNRYTINVRGASSTAYGSLKEANIVTEFATLVKVTMPSPTAQDVALQHMRPLERLGEDSGYTAWMTDYGEEAATDSSDETGDDSGDDSDDSKDEPNEAMLEGGNEMDYD
jgi:hypothetical protein